MQPMAAALYEAHVAFVMARFQGIQLKALIQEETAFVWDQLANVPLNEVLTKAEILDFQQRNFDHRKKASDPVKAYARSLQEAVTDHLRQSKASLKDVVDKKDYDRFIKEASQLKDLRERLIHAAVTNPLYAEVISNTLADGIKSFTSEEGLAGKIPGASSFFKMGNSLLGGLQDSIDRNVRKFISENIQKLTNQSEKFVQDLINDKKVVELGEKFWQKAASRPVSAALKHFDARQYDPFEPIVEDMVNHALRSGIARELNEVVIDHFLKENGQKSLQQLLLDIEIRKEDVLRESEELFVKIADRARKDGSLEVRVRAHLAAFYNSEYAAAVLGK